MAGHDQADRAAPRAAHSLDEVSPPEFVIKRPTQLVRLARSHGLDFRLPEQFGADRPATHFDPEYRGPR